ncbi:lipid A-modifier LpxR family protein [Dyadobacter sp. LHD-138]|uniref:lipid A-modifier LpxR family protein n=1 Tax=Dyadobacter sp. LHD-138 TaxID=3071413 RepID=UPI0027E04DBA|nr:lipid A-modifier LpxR family protein [Dyadobacter sp. LHD-138]MDQ6477916.1 DUF2219 family protein [Dyadobacter sp. LHD-138]
MKNLATFLLLISISGFSAYAQNPSPNTKSYRVQKLDTTISAYQKQTKKVSSGSEYNKGLLERGVAPKDTLKSDSIQINPAPGVKPKNITTEIKTERDSAILDKTQELIRVLDLRNPAGNEDSLSFYLDQIRNYETMVFLMTAYQVEVDSLERNFENSKSVFLEKQRRNLKQVKRQYQFLENQIYSIYRDSNISNDWFRAFMAYHDNDFLLLPPFGKKMNKDRDYTGGARLEILTDQFKLRFFSDLFNQLWFINGSELFNNKFILSYQGIFYGVEAYTPYIRFGSDSTIALNGENALRDMSYNVDRPFASFQYFGRSKYYLHYTGAWRAKLETKIGWIGKDAGRKVQDILHRDITLASVHVNRWEDQIGNGGRLAFNLDYSLDLMLFSRDGDVFKPKRPDNESKETYRKRRINIYTPVELHYGNVLTAAGAGIGFSNRSFKDRSGNYGFMYPESRFVKSKFRIVNWIRHTFYYSVETKLRYVIHNSLIQGVGVFKTRESDQDGTDDEFLSKRKLIPYTGPAPLDPLLNYNFKEGRLINWIWTTDFSLSMKLRKSTLFITQSFNTREYKYPSRYVDEVVQFANQKTPLGSSTWNENRREIDKEEKYAVNQIDAKLYNARIRGFGRVGFLFEF